MLLLGFLIVVGTERWLLLITLLLGAKWRLLLLLLLLLRTIRWWLLLLWAERRLMWLRTVVRSVRLRGTEWSVLGTEGWSLRLRTVRRMLGTVGRLLWAEGGGLLRVWAVRRLWTERRWVAV